MQRQFITSCGTRRARLLRCIEHKSTSLMRWEVSQVVGVMGQLTLQVRGEMSQRDAELERTLSEMQEMMKMLQATQHDQGTARAESSAQNMVLSLQAQGQESAAIRIRDMEPSTLRKSHLPGRMRRLGISRSRKLRSKHEQHSRVSACEGAEFAE